MTGFDSATTAAAERGLTLFCIPVFNDWDAALQLLSRLERVARGLEGPAGVVLVDDGSHDPVPSSPLARLRGFASLEVLTLRRNVGHQRAIALGLAYIHRHRPCRAVVVMDGDGEDGPEDVPRLLERCRETGWSSIVFARRTRRSEGLLFLVGYQGFRAIHYLLTGLRVEVGNFSAVPFPLLDRLVGISELWNHYAAAVIHARLPVEKVPIPRRQRLAGEARMSVTALVIHGLSAISVYGAQIGVRLLGFVAGLMLLSAAAVLGVLGARLLAGVPIPSWAGYAAGFLVVGLLNLLLLSTVFVLFVLQSRNVSPFLPIRDWAHYVARVEVLVAAAGSPSTGPPPREGPGPTP